MSGVMKKIDIPKKLAYEAIDVFIENRMEIFLVQLMKHILVFQK